jgi:hypothetical protein
MKDMSAHLERLRQHAAECELVSRKADSGLEKREMFALMAQQLSEIADILERTIISVVHPDTFLGRKTHEPFPTEEE